MPIGFSTETDAVGAAMGAYAAEAASLKSMWTEMKGSIDGFEAPWGDDDAAKILERSLRTHRVEIEDAILWLDKKLLRAGELLGQFATNYQDTDAANRTTTP